MNSFMPSFSKYFLVVFTMFLWGCSKTDVEEYRDNMPNFSFKDFFTGPVEAWGIIQDFNDKMSKSFTIRINGSWDGKAGRIEELFNWSDGTITERVWRIDHVSDHQYKGYTQEMDGEALGHASGNVMNWKYKLNVPINGELIEINFDDWCYAVDQNVIINRSKMKKMGITIGEITIVMKKVKTDSGAPLATS
jgi:hypothetical protein